MRLFHNNPGDTNTKISPANRINATPFQTPIWVHLWLRLTSTHGMFNGTSVCYRKIESHCKGSILWSLLFTAWIKRQKRMNFSVFRNFPESFDCLSASRLVFVWMSYAFAMKSAVIHTLTLLSSLLLIFYEAPKILIYKSKWTVFSLKLFYYNYLFSIYHN